jgi:hypothetical protein
MQTVDNSSIVRLAGNLADWLMLVQGMSAEEVEAVGEALRSHAAWLQREEACEPAPFEGTHACRVLAPAPPGNALNN